MKLASAPSRVRLLILGALSDPTTNTQERLDAQPIAKATLERELQRLQDEQMLEHHKHNLFLTRRGQRALNALRFQLGQTAPARNDGEDQAQMNAA